MTSAQPTSSAGTSVTTEVYSSASDLEQCGLFEKAILPFYQSKSANTRRAMWSSMAWKFQPLAFMAVDEELQNAFYSAMDIADTTSYEQVAAAPDSWAQSMGEIMAICDLGFGYKFDALNAALAP